jgi:hypothetical protein
MAGSSLKFVIATKHFAGLGLALRLQEEGHEVLVAPTGIGDRRLSERYALVGNGMVHKRALVDVIDDRRSYAEHYFIWDENHSVDANELLRTEGFRVFGGGAYADTMEHDRDACLAQVAPFGLEPPASFSFRSIADGLRFVQEHPDTAYVYKPDFGENYETWLPHAVGSREANEELCEHLGALTEDKPFLLQERKDGIEANVEVWFVDGEPRFAFMDLECKYKLTGDLGSLIGCALDFVFVLPLESRAVQETVGKLFPMYRAMRYTGFGDANFVVGRDGIWFFEKCERFGYNSHPNLLWTLNRTPLGELLVSFLDGTFAPNFSSGFGASCSLYMDPTRSGEALHLPASVARDMYFYDVYKADGRPRIAGYYDNVGIATSFGHTMASAWKRALEIAYSVRFAGRAFRVDGAAAGFPTSPVRRYEALAAMGFI